MAQVIACSSMMPPHEIHLYRIDDLDDAENGLVAHPEARRRRHHQQHVAFERMRA